MFRVFLHSAHLWWSFDWEWDGANGDSVIVLHCLVLKLWVLFSRQLPAMTLSYCLIKQWSSRASSDSIQNVFRCPYYVGNYRVSSVLEL